MKKTTKNCFLLLSFLSLSCGTWGKKKDKHAEHPAATEDAHDGTKCAKELLTEVGAVQDELTKMTAAMHAKKEKPAPGYQNPYLGKTGMVDKKMIKDKLPALKTKLHALEEKQKISVVNCTKEGGEAFQGDAVHKKMATELEALEKTAK